MAALDTPWLAHMATPSRPSARGDGESDAAPAVDSPYGSVPPTYAAFSSSNLSTAAASAARRSTILVHQKSPLLLATPPQVTRALAYSHPFLLPLNKLAGLLSWTTGDPWESFLLLVAFWAVVHYGDAVVRYAGPIVAVTIIIAGMYGRRFSPLSSSGWAEHPSWQPSNTKASKKAGTLETSPNGAPAKKGDHQRNTSETTNTRHQKTLDEIVDTLKVLTTRCNILLEPMLRMTDFLSTQRTATSATTRPALTTLFVRILAVTPIWVALTLPPLRIITTKRVVLLFGTIVLSWHSRVCRVTRTLLWRSAAVRRLARWITGLQFEGPKKPTHAAKNETKANGKNDAKSNEKTPSTPEKKRTSLSASALTAAIQRRRSAYGKETGVRFTFIIYENQRRWVGLGWTNSLFAYERAAWTDEHNNPVPPRDQFELPEVEDGPGKWRWVKGSKWRVDGAPDVQDDSEYDGEATKNGWIFYDNKWNNGRRGQDGWGRWTRRRKWYRDAELVEVDDEVSEEAVSSPEATSPSSPSPPALPPRQNAQSAAEADASTLSTSAGTTTSEPSHSQSSKDNEREDTDSLSVLSNSSKSARFKWPGLGGHSNHSAPQLRKKPSRDTKRSRRPSDGASVHENDISLTPALELEIQGSRKDQETWGFGDDVTMGLA